MPFCSVIENTRKIDDNDFEMNLLLKYDKYFNTKQN